MVNEIEQVLETLYNNQTVRKSTVPLFLSNAGLGKTSIIRKFAEKKNVRLHTMILSQLMPMEVSGCTMPDIKSKKMIICDSEILLSLKAKDILFLDECLTALPQTLNAFLNLLTDRTLPSGEKLEDIIIVAASNPQNMPNLTAAVKQRFLKIDLKFNKLEFQQYFKHKFGMPETISNNLALLVQKEKFESSAFNYVTPRSIEICINMIGSDCATPYDDTLLPFLKQEIDSPMDISLLNVKKGEKVEYLSILKLLIKEANKTKNNDTKNNVKKSRVTDNISC